MKEYCSIPSADPSFNFRRYLRNAVDHEDTLNQTTVGVDDEILVLPGPTPSEPTPSEHAGLDTPLAGNHSSRSKKQARKRKRQQAIQNADGLDYNVRRVAGKRNISSADDIQTGLSTDGLPAASTGFVGKAEADWEEDLQRVWLEDLFPDNAVSEYTLVEYKPQ